MITYERKVRFEEVDAASIVFFARFLHYAHEAMEEFFGGLEGGYVGAVMGRAIGFPAVHVDTTYLAPLRYGDTVAILTDIVHLGSTSCTLRYRFQRNDGVHAATVRHTVVCCALREPAGPRKLPFPPDVRALLEQHLAPDAPPTTTRRAPRAAVG